MTVYRGDGFSYRGTVKTLSGASDSPDITFSLVSEPDMRPRLRFPTFLALPGLSKNSPTKFCREVCFALRFPYFRDFGCHRQIEPGSWTVRVLINIPD